MAFAALHCDAGRAKLEIVITRQDQQRLEAEHRRMYSVTRGFAVAGLMGGAVVLVALLAAEDWLLDRAVPSLVLTALSECKQRDPVRARLQVQMSC
jgi:hypothetical protein